MALEYEESFDKFDVNLAKWNNNISTNLDFPEIK